MFINANSNEIELIKHGLSDHDGLVKFTSPDNLPIININMLTLCVPNNNSFRRMENSDQYKARLDKYISLFKEIKTKYPNAVICIQEFPDNKNVKKFRHASQFVKQLKNLGYEIKSTQTKPSDFHQAIVYPTAHYTESKTQPKLPVLPNLNNRAVLANLVNKSTNEELSIASIHGDFNLQSETLKDIRKLVEAGYIIAADANINLSNAHSSRKLSPEESKYLENFLQSSSEYLIENHSRKIGGATYRTLDFIIDGRGIQHKLQLEQSSVLAKKEAQEETVADPFILSTVCFKSYTSPTSEDGSTTDTSASNDMSFCLNSSKSK